MEPMKPMVITIHVECRDDVPPEVLDWMVDTLVDHVRCDFGARYDPAMTAHLMDDGYEKSPLLTGRIRGHVAPDVDVLDNERQWRSMGAPRSAVRLPDDGT